LLPELRGVELANLQGPRSRKTTGSTLHKDVEEEGDGKPVDPVVADRRRTVAFLVEKKKHSSSLTLRLSLVYLFLTIVFIGGYLLFPRTPAIHVIGFELPPFNWSDPTTYSGVSFPINYTAFKILLNGKGSFSVQNNNYFPAFLRATRVELYSGPLKLGELESNNISVLLPALGQVNATVPLQIRMDGRALAERLAGYHDFSQLLLQSVLPDIVRDLLTLSFRPSFVAVVEAAVLGINVHLVLTGVAEIDLPINKALGFDKQSLPDGF